MNASPFTLRPYQQHAVDANEAAWRGDRRPTGSGVVNRTSNVLATGLGKTVIFSAMAKNALNRGERSIVLVHREELANQAMHKLHSMAPKARIGLVKAERNEWDADIVVASVPSIGRLSQLERRGIPSDRFGLGIADECHHSAADTWRSAMSYFGAFNGMPWAGFSATLDRGDSRGLGEIWQEIVADRDISFGIREKFLVPVRGRRIQVRDLMLDSVRRSRGDFQDNDLGDALEDADAGNAIARAYLEHCPGKRAVLFCPTVHSARRFADDLNEAGIPTEVITGEIDSITRAAIYERFRTGVTKVLSSVMVLTEGWDAPWAEVAIMARPTQSAALYIQCVGRVLRPFPAGGKTEALVLDVVGASQRHSLVSLKNLSLDSPASSLYPEDSEPGEKKEDAGEFIEDEYRHVEGELIATEVDLFTASDSAWLQTDHGLWFIPTSESYWYLWPKDDGTFGLGQKYIKSGRGHGEVIENNMTFEGGMAWAEKYASEEDHSISSKSAVWRKKKPSEKLANYATALGIPVLDQRQGALSDLITRKKATAVLPVPPRVR